MGNEIWKRGMRPGPDSPLPDFLHAGGEKERRAARASALPILVSPALVALGFLLIIYGAFRLLAVAWEDQLPLLVTMGALFALAVPIILLCGVFIARLGIGSHPSMSVTLLAWAAIVGGGWSACLIHGARRRKRLRGRKEKTGAIGSGF